MAMRSIPVGTKIMCALCGQDISKTGYSACHVNCRSTGEDGAVTQVCIDCWHKPGLLVEAEIDEDLATDCVDCGEVVERPMGTVCDLCDDFRCNPCHTTHNCPRTFASPMAMGPHASLLADLGVSCRAAGIEAAEMWAAVVAGDLSLEPDDPRGLCDEPPLVPWRDQERLDD